MSDRAKKQELLDRAATPGEAIPLGGGAWLADLLISGKLTEDERALFRSRFPRPYLYARRLSYGVYAIATLIVVAFFGFAAGFEGAAGGLVLVAIGVGLYHGQRSVWRKVTRRERSELRGKY